MIHTETVPVGWEIVFEDGLPDAMDNKKRRSHKVDGETFPSVTTILNCIKEPGALMAWAAKETREGRDYNETRDTAATRGTSIHNALEVLAREGTPPSLSEFPEEDRGYVSGLCAWWLDHSPEAILIEQLVASKAHRYAGRFDLLANIDGQRTLADLKTGKAVYPEAHFQIEGYRLALEECGFIPAERGAIVRVGEDGSYEFVESRAAPQDFLAVAQVYEAKKMVARKPKKVAA